MRTTRVLGFLTGLLLAYPVPAIAFDVKVVVTIFEVEVFDEIDEPSGDADFYAAVTIDGVQKSTDQCAFEDAGDHIFPNWEFSQNVDINANPDEASVAIEIWDDDSPCPGSIDIGTGDEQMDIDPGGGRTLNFVVDLNPCAVSGEASGACNAELTATGNAGDDVGRIKFSVRVLVADTDSDGDALPDNWETGGVDFGAAGVLLLPGADPMRKDLFLELDCLVDDQNNDGTLDPEDHSHCPRQDALTNTVSAFAEAPITNLDGTTGIQLHIDVGPIFGAGTVMQVAGTGGVTGSFGDLGGGNAIPESGNEIIDWDGATGDAGTNFFTLKSANFDSRRNVAFRYGIFGHQTNSRRPLNDCTSGRAEAIPGNDFMVTLGGGSDIDGDGTPDVVCWNESGPNGIDEDGDGATDEDIADNADNDGDCPGDTNGDGDVCERGDIGVDEDGGFSLGSRRQQAGSLMHEFGHVLGLGHGGDSGVNRKPNYLSVMSYAFQMCQVPASPDGTLPGACDLSRLAAPAMPDLDQASLDECVGLNAGLGYGPMDWDGDGNLEGATNCTPPNNTNVWADINNDSDCVTSGADGSLETAADGGDIASGNQIRNGPDLDCDTTADMTDEQARTPGTSEPNPLTSFDDWNGLVYNFRQLGTYADGVTADNIVEADPPTIERARDFIAERLVPILDVEKTAPPTVLPGETILYDIVVGNAGTGPALKLNLLDELPDGSTLEESDSGLAAGEQFTRQVTFQVAEDACPQTLTNHVTITGRDFVGNPVSATDSAGVEVLDITPPEISVSVDPTTLFPPNHKMVDIVATVEVTDECDPNPSVVLVSVTSNEPDNGTGDGNTVNDIQDAAAGTDDREFRLRAERSGKGSGRIYTIVYRAEDASGNTATASATVAVPRSKKK